MLFTKENMLKIVKPLSLPICFLFFIVSAPMTSIIQWGAIFLVLSFLSTYLTMNTYHLCTAAVLIISLTKVANKFNYKNVFCTENKTILINLLKNILIFSSIMFLLAMAGTQPISLASVLSFNAFNITILITNIFTSAILSRLMFKTLNNISNEKITNIENATESKLLLHLIGELNYDTIIDNYLTPVTNQKQEPK